MENKELNLCEILKDCPTGTKFWSSVWGDVTFVQINDVGVFPIVLSAKSFSNISLRSNGKMYDIKEAECLVFPSKDQRDWSKFKVPTEESKVSVKRFNPKEFKPFDKVLIRDRGNFKWLPSFFEKNGEPKNIYKEDMWPISLTKEFFTSNGFEVLYSDNQTMKLYNGEHSLRVNIIDGNKFEVRPIGYIEYVHEFQHLLRMFKLYEYADNLKV